MFNSSQSKKELTVVIIVLAILFFLATAFIPIYMKTISNAFNISPQLQEKPKIVDYFACSDYCPGSEEKYMVKIYQSIEDEARCKEIGGYPYTYTGWQKQTICLVNKTKTLSLEE